MFYCFRCGGRGLGGGWGLTETSFEQIVSNNMRSKDSDEKFPWKGAKWLFGQLLLAKCFNLKLGEVAQGKFFAWHPDNGWWLAASFQFFPQNINFFQRRLNGSKTRKTELMISYSCWYHQSSWESHLFTPLLLESQHLVLKISFFLYISLFFVCCFLDYPLVYYFCITFISKFCENLRLTSG